MLCLWLNLNHGRISSQVLATVLVRNAVFFSLHYCCHIIFTAGGVNIAHNTTTRLTCDSRISIPSWYMNGSLVLPGPQYQVKVDPSTGGFLGLLTIDGNETYGILDLRCRVLGQTVHNRTLTIGGLFTWPYLNILITILDGDLCPYVIFLQVAYHVLRM